MYNAPYTSQQGLTPPAYEYDGCGVGFVCQMTGGASHDIVEKGLTILENLEHRGGCGCDERTGDGAGLLIQLPHAFFEKAGDDLGIPLPEPGDYGAGLVFLPEDDAARERCMSAVEDAIHDAGQHLLGWRDVPTDNSDVGVSARRKEPVIRQVFIGRGEGTPGSKDNRDEDGGAFERALYVIRKHAAKRVRGMDFQQKERFHIPSLSSKTIVYKGMLTAGQLRGYFPDLSDPSVKSQLALYHSRYSTNTMPRWSLAQPFRFLCHNGEINTLRGNVNRMNAREQQFASERFGDDMDKLRPVLDADASDSAVLDSALELIHHTGRSLPHAMMMLVPEPWERHDRMSQKKRDFYEYHSCIAEPWDGPATLPFTDGSYIGATLDRNGLRPSRYTITEDGLVVLASEAGVLDLDPARVEEKGRLQPGRMFLVDLDEGRRVPDAELKEQMSERRPYGEWLDDHLITLLSLPEAAPETVPAPFDNEDDSGRGDLRTQQQLFGYTREDLTLMMEPMGEEGKDPVGSMGDDTPLAVLSDRSRLLYDYFKQLFAQVTNPPLDPIREKLVTSLFIHLGDEGDLFDETPEHCHQLRLDQPILTSRHLAQIRAGNVTADADPTASPDERLRSRTLSTLFDPAPDDSSGGDALEDALDRLCSEAEDAVRDGTPILVLSDRGAGRGQAPIPALLATGAVHHHLIREGLRTKCGIIVESGEPREVHHFCLLISYGAGAINPYLAMDSVRAAARRGELGDKTEEQAVKNYIKAGGKGILKVMSKMGISTLESYRGAQIFEAVGLADDVIEPYFTGTASRLGGVGLDVLAQEVQDHHARAFPPPRLSEDGDLDPGGRFHWRRNGEHHVFNPHTIAKLQDAIDREDPGTYDEYAKLVNDQNKKLGTLRGLLDFRTGESASVPLDEVEPWEEIVKRFKTGAMSYGSISQETHETLAEAMNEMGGKSNTGEGGEHPDRYPRDSKVRSRIKQVASGRFGVTSGYLTSADELQIKMAQGAKPGEGGQLPGKKVYPWIAEVRHSTPHVGLISPPPHHDIYSIEDLAQLIHDLKNANREAGVSVKLVSEVGVGTVAAGVAKGKADLVLISGNDGGTGASPRTSLAHAGLPWELGLAEANQRLVEQGLRSRIRVECDGGLKTGRDVAVAALLGADEFGFSTAPLVSMGCIMMRKCHLNTCPVGIATQDPELREKFEGEPEHVINYFYFVANEIREIMADLGFRTVDEMIGRVDKLEASEDVDHWKARALNLDPLLEKPERPSFLEPFITDSQDHGLDEALDHDLIAQAQPALDDEEPVELDVEIHPTNRTVGTMLSNELTKRYGEDGLPDDTITLNCAGAAGQSFFAFAAPGLTACITGEANDYFGKGLSGAKLVLRPPADAGYAAEDNIIVGNVALYGATSGEVYVRGQAGERFCVRNSGARAVVEGVGDHGCEYMTGGRVVVLGETGRNFAAGMSGGIAYVWDRSGAFADRCNQGMVDLENLPAGSDEAAEVRTMIERHAEATDSPVARRALADWPATREQLVKVMPRQYREALERQRQQETNDAQPETVAA
jgi:glutamate synthase domain-containing protein 2/glutamate synthase domain-containing protein 1/glutamate synthase domain-containing protein 3